MMYEFLLPYLKELKKIKNIAIYGFLTFFLVPELLRSKDLKNDLKNGTEVWVKSQSKLIESVSSCHGHLAKMNL